jgi:hypothetical protein
LAGVQFVDVNGGALGVRQLVSAMAEGAHRKYYLKRP